MTNYEEYVNQLESELAMARQQTQDVQQSANSIFMGQQESNLIEFQLEMDNILERIDHLLRGHILKFDEKGNMIWKEPGNSNYQVFNEYGVQEILRILSMYINRNTILSNYDDKVINWKVYDLGYNLTDLIFLKYEDMFAYKKFKDYLKKGQKRKELSEAKIKQIEDKVTYELKEKIKLYPLLVQSIVDIVHSAYLRALNGGERESLRTARNVTQAIPLNNNNQLNGISPQPKRSLFKPSTWI